MDLRSVPSPVVVAAQACVSIIYGGRKENLSALFLCLGKNDDQGNDNAGSQSNEAVFFVFTFSLR